MRLLGKITQLAELPLSCWLEFICGWLWRHVSHIVPCAVPGTQRLIYVPSGDFYESYVFFAESPQGRRELAFFLSKVRAGDVIYDIGAFRGVYSAGAKAVFGEQVTIHLFEPIGSNAERISTIAQLNRFQGFEIINKAVGSGEPVRGVLRQDDMLCSEYRQDDVLAVNLPSTSVDAYAHATGVIPTVLKIDVEGFEEDVLAGANDCLTTHGPRLWLELHPSHLQAQGISWKSIVNRLESLGYTVSLFSDYDLPMREQGFHVWCERKPRCQSAALAYEQLDLPK